MACGVSCARMMLIIFNVFFWLSGLAVLAVGIWILVDSTILDIVDFVSVGEDDNLVEYAAYLLIGIGAFAIIVGFCGCCGAIKRNKCMLGMYIFFLFIIMAGELGAGVLVVVYKDDVEDKLSEELLDEFTDPENKPFVYMDDNDDNKWKFSAFGQLLSVVQKELDCCGIEGASDYDKANVRVSSDTSGTGTGQWRYLPTCCQTVIKSRDTLAEKPEKWVTKVSEYVEGFAAEGECTDAGETWTKGCVNEAKDWFSDKAVLLIGVGIGIACLEIFGFIFAICLCRNVED